MSRSIQDAPDEWSDEEKHRYAEYLAYDLTDAEADTFNALATDFHRRMKEAFGDRATSC